MKQLVRHASGGVIRRLGIELVLGDEAMGLRQRDRMGVTLDLLETRPLQPDQVQADAEKPLAGDGLSAFPASSS